MRLQLSSLAVIIIIPLHLLLLFFKNANDRPRASLVKVNFFFLEETKKKKKIMHVYNAGGQSGLGRYHAGTWLTMRRVRHATVGPGGGGGGGELASSIITEGHRRRRRRALSAERETRHKRYKPQISI